MAVEDIAAMQQIAENINEYGVAPNTTSPRLVNADEVINEVIPVPVLHFIETDVTDDEGNALIDPITTKPYKTRFAKTRTAKIQNVVPLPIYNQVVAKRDQLNSGSMEENFALIQDLVWQVWQISEPWFSKKMFNECLDANQVVKLFQRFFSESRLNRIKV